MAENAKMTAEAVAQKVRWEGGLWATLEYGVRADDIEDPSIAELWSRLERGFNELAPLLDEAAARLDVAA